MIKPKSAGSWVAPPVTETWRRRRSEGLAAALDVWSALPLISGTTFYLLRARLRASDGAEAATCVRRASRWKPRLSNTVPDRSCPFIDTATVF